MFLLNVQDESLSFNRGIQYDFALMSIRKVPWAKPLIRQLFPRDLANLMNAKIMFYFYYCINAKKQVKTNSTG